MRLLMQHVLQRWTIEWEEFGILEFTWKIWVHIFAIEKNSNQNISTNFMRTKEFMQWTDLLQCNFDVERVSVHERKWIPIKPLTEKIRWKSFAWYFLLNEMHGNWKLLENCWLFSISAFDQVFVFDESFRAF